MDSNEQIKFTVNNSDTYIHTHYNCPKCGSLLLQRIYYIAGNPVVDWYCPVCHGYSSASATYSSTSTNSYDINYRNLSLEKEN